MNNKGSPAGSSVEAGQVLRKRAEEKVRSREHLELGEPLPGEARGMHYMLHELRVHQAELEMQNEELRQTREELEAARAKYFDLYNLAPVGYFTISAEGLILEANLTAANLLGMERIHLVNQPFTRLIVPDDQDVHYLSHKKLLEMRKPQSCELRMKRSDGALLCTRCDSLFVTSAEGNIAQIRTIVVDITELKNLEQVRDDFVHAVVHDLKSPITGIKLELGMLDDQIASLSAECSAEEPCLRTFSGYDASLKQKIADIHEGIDQLYLMILSLLKLGEIEGEKLELHYEPFAMNDLLGELERNFRGRAAAKGVAIEFSSAFTRTVIADLKLLKRVLQNLVDNAIKYSLPNTVITIDAYSGVKKDVSCENIMVSVTNTGQPLTENKINALFQKFKTHGHAESGSGIGLFFCLKTMNLLGGGIYVDQDTDTITFHIFFPNG